MHVVLIPLVLLSTSPPVKDGQPPVNRIRRSFELGDGDKAFVGRTSKTHKDRQAAPSNAFFEGSTVSREHGYLRNRNGTLMYADTCSRMGTRINDKPLTKANVETKLFPGDVIALAAHKRTSSLVEFKVYFSENKAELPAITSVPVPPLRVLTPESSNNSSGVVHREQEEQAKAGDSSGSGSAGESHGEQILDEGQVHESARSAHANSPVFVPYDAHAADTIDIDDDSDEDDDDDDVELSSDDCSAESEDDLVDSDEDADEDADEDVGEDVDEDADEDADVIEVDTTVDTSLGFGDSFVALSDSDDDSENDDDYIDSNREDCEGCEECGYYEIGDDLIETGSDSAGSPGTVLHKSVTLSVPMSTPAPQPPCCVKKPNASAEALISDPKPTNDEALSTKMQNAHAISVETSSTSSQGAWVVCHASTDACMETSQPSEAPTPAEFAVASPPRSSTSSSSTNSGTNNSTKRKLSGDDDSAAGPAAPPPQKRARSSAARTAAKELAKGLFWSIVGGAITFAALAASAPPDL